MKKTDLDVNAQELYVWGMFVFTWNFSWHRFVINSSTHTVLFSIKYLEVRFHMWQQVTERYLLNWHWCWPSVTFLSDCKSKKDPGPCNKHLKRFYYHRRWNVCKPFHYGGCKGNGNNYKSKKACEKRCVRPSPKPGHYFTVLTGYALPCHAGEDSWFKCNYIPNFFWKNTCVLDISSRTK